MDWDFEAAKREEWKPLYNVVSPPPLPVDVFPGIWGEMIKAVAQHKETTPDLPAVCALGAVSSCVNGFLRIQAADGWKPLPVKAYFVGAAPSGSAKSPIMTDLCGYLFRHQETENRGRPSCAVYENEIRRREAEITKTISKGGGAQAVKQFTEQLEAYRRENGPKERFIRGSDFTPEGLARKMAEQESPVAVIDQEGVLFEILGGMYSDIPNLSLFLDGYDETEVSASYRKSGNLRILNPALALCVLTQTSVIRQALSNQHMVTKGFLPRFMIGVSGRPERVAEDWPEAIPDDLTRKYELALYSVCNQRGAAVIMATPEASRVLREWVMENDRKPEDHPLAVNDFIGKQQGNACKLAGLLWAMDGKGGDVTGEQMKRAVRLARYFSGCTEYLLRHGDGLTDKAEKLAMQKIRKRVQNGNEASAYQVKQDLKNHRMDAASSDRVLAKLVYKGYIRLYPDDGKAKTIFINPYLTGGDLG